MKITVEANVPGEVEKVWNAYNDPEAVKRWNAASDDWHTTSSEIDLREGGRFKARMEAKDGSEGFDFEGTYTRIVPHKRIEYRMPDGREVQVEFQPRDGSTYVKVTFDAETVYPPEVQRQGWQAILDNFSRYVAKN